MTDRTRTACPRHPRLLRVALGGGALATALLALGGGVASAHVTVSAPEATPGGSDAVITFRVPDESESARTVGLKVRLPADTPIASVLVQPKPGWSVTVSQAKLATPIKTDDGEVTEAVSEIDWKVSAGGQGIAPGQFDAFSFIAGQLPDAKSLTFKAVQNYSDGSTTSWIEEPAPGSTAEPEHPAPVLTLGAGSSGSSGASTGSGSSSSSGASEPASSPSGSASAADSATSNAEAAPDDPASKASAVTGIVLGGIGVLLGLAALVLALRPPGGLTGPGGRSLIPRPAGRIALYGRGHADRHPLGAVRPRPALRQTSRRRPARLPGQQDRRRPCRGRHRSGGVPGRPGHLLDCRREARPVG